VALRGVDAERSYFADWCAASGRTLDARRADARVGRRYRIVSRFVDLVAMVAILGLLWIALRDGRATGGAIVAFLVAYQRLIGDLNQMMAEWHAVQRALPSLGIIRKLLELPQEPEDGLPIPDGPVEIRLEDVCFRYPGAERDVLSHIDFVVRPGEHLALVGRNGSGKSTLAKLVTGMYRPTSGRILVNGVDVALVRPRDLRRLLSILPQEDRIFEGTVRELIALGDAERPFDPLRFARAVHVSGFAGVMEKLPLGDMTVIGREFSLPEDDATTLSGGEAQLLGLSRALYRDVPVYWLDEPTSKVDAERQEAFFSRIFAAMEGRTLVFVSHLFGSVRRAPRVVVLDGGRLVEDGDPCELLRCGGVYAELFRSQA
jgi:ABC-type bacteriocin/lantibiotic exporter with double-glycine peptidase domain